MNNNNYCYPLVCTVYNICIKKSVLKYLTSHDEPFLHILLLEKIVVQNTIKYNMILITLLTNLKLLGANEKWNSKQV